MTSAGGGYQSDRFGPRRQAVIAQPQTGGGRVFVLAYLLAPIKMHLGESFAVGRAID